MRYLAAIVGCGALILGARLNPAPPVDMGRPVVLDSIHMITPLVGWATTAGAIVRTVDGGRDWTPLPLPGHGAVGSTATQFLDARTAWVAVDHPDGTMTLQVTYDGGRAWLFGGLVIGAAFPHQLVFLDARRGWLFVGGGGMHSNGLALYRTVDGGRHWEKVTTRLPISGLLGFATPTTGWATDEHTGGVPACPRTISVISPGALYVTRDGGRSWRLQRLPIPPGYCASILSFTPDSLPGQLVFSTPRDGVLPVNFSMSGSRPPALVVYDTHDGGRTWQAPPPLALHTASTVILTDFLNVRDGWAATTERPRTGVSVTVDGARHWRLLPAALPEPATFSYLYALDVVTRRVGFALVGQPIPGGRRALLRTSDGARSWTLIRPRLQHAETPMPTPSPSCGPWSAPTGAIGRPITARYGEIRDCLRVGHQWVLTTLGRAEQSGVIALYPCRPGDTPCLDGWTPHPFAYWRFYPPPHRGGVTILARFSPNVLIIDNAGYQLCFNLRIHRYDTNPQCQ